MGQTRVYRVHKRAVGGVIAVIVCAREEGFRCARVETCRVFCGHSFALCTGHPLLIFPSTPSCPNFCRSSTLSPSSLKISSVCCPGARVSFASLGKSVSRPLSGVLDSRGCGAGMVSAVARVIDVVAAEEAASVAASAGLNTGKAHASEPSIRP